MAYEAYPFPARNGETMQGLRCAAGGGYACPVCGEEGLPEPPYAPDTGVPSMAWCPGCDTQFGWDDAIAPDAPPGTLADVWERLRCRKHI